MRRLAESAARFAGILALGWIPAWAEEVSYESTVQSIVKERCVECHNPGKRKGDLDLSSPEGLSIGGESGPVFKKGDPEHSHLLELVVSGEMPKKGEKLTEREIEAIRRWIQSGAKFDTPPVVAEAEMTEHEVLPILLRRCTACHGRQKQEGNLDLRTVESIRKGGKSGPAFLAGDPDGSRMIQRVESEACPPREQLLKSFVRRPPAGEVETLKQWISAGAPTGGLEPDIASGEPDPMVSDEERTHWAFVPPRRLSSGGNRAPTIDFFIERKLRQQGLEFSPEAGRDVLIRRAYLAMLGMPPSVADWRRWHESDDAGWFESMIDELLASPHYGERWGRYWLDLAGYADSEGGVSADPIRPVAWKYRDYVIAAFNEDKPYDEFLLQQIAGDELLDYENADPVTEEMIENLVATGFLRMGIDETGSRTMNFVENRIGVIADAIDVLGSSVMGLTMECVRCHSHQVRSDSPARLLPDEGCLPGSPG